MPSLGAAQFRIMSMPKMVATVAALRLVEQDRLQLGGPVAEYCPEDADLQVLLGSTAIPRSRGHRPAGPLSGS